MKFSQSSENPAKNAEFARPPPIAHIDGGASELPDCCRLRLRVRAAASGKAD
jgi:hypothetical protein